MSRTLRGRAVGLEPAGAGPTSSAAVLEALKRTLQEATDLMAPWRQFHDEVAMVPAFSIGSKPGRDKKIESVLEALAGQLLERRCEVSHPMCLHLPNYRFWHGTCQLGPRMVIFFYFEDIDVGLAGFFHKNTDTRVDLARFSLIDMPSGTGLSRDRGQA